jgi:hypothetical protein
MRKYYLVLASLFVVQVAHACCVSCNIEFAQFTCQCQATVGINKCRGFDGAGCDQQYFQIPCGSSCQVGSGGPCVERPTRAKTTEILPREQLLVNARASATSECGDPGDFQRWFEKRLRLQASTIKREEKGF